jgi:hypothetical protein
MGDEEMGVLVVFDDSSLSSVSVYNDQKPGIVNQMIVNQMKQMFLWLTPLKEIPA